MKNLFFVGLIFCVFNATGQGLFTKRPFSILDAQGADTARQSSLRVTYLGKSFVEMDEVTQAGDIRTGGFQKDWFLGADSLELVLRGLQTGIRWDSIRLSKLKERVVVEGAAGSSASLPEARLPFADIPSVLPIRIGSWRDYQLSSGFGIRFHPVLHRWLPHNGLDFPTPVGTDVHVTADGWVDRVGFDAGGLGLWVRVRHPSGYSTLYGHLSDRGVMPAQWVGRGERIGRTGSTGLSTGPHLHYAVWDGDNPVNPVDFCFLLLHWTKTNHTRQSK